MLNWQNCACLSLTDHGHLAQYGCDGAHEEAGLGHELVQPASLSPRHPVIRNSADMARKGTTQQLISLLLISDGQGSNNVSQSDLDVSELHWHLISIGLVPGLEQTLGALCHELHIQCEHLQRFPQPCYTWLLLGQYGAKILSPFMWLGKNENPHVY